MLVYLIFICAVNCFLCEVVNIGAVFENDEKAEKTFNFAIKNFNEKNEGSEFTFNSIIKNNLSESHPYTVMQSVCSILEEGVVAIFGPRSYQNIAVVHSVCDVKDIPHIVTRWSSFYIEDKTIINFYPHSNTLSKAYFDIILEKRWTTFTVLYDDNESLLRLKDLIETAQDNGIVTQVLQLDQYHSGNYRTTFKKLKLSGQKFLVIDCHIDNLIEVLSQLQQAGLMNDDYKYFLTNLDAHTENLTPFQYSNTDFTAIRLINPEQENLQKISSDLFSEEDFNLFETPSWKLQLEQALLIDAINMFAKVFIDMQTLSGAKTVTENNNSLVCSDLKSWEHGLSIVNMVKSYSYEGLTGKIMFDNEGYRSNFDLTIYELLEGGITDIGIWKSSTGLNISRPRYNIIEDEPESLRNKSFNVLITLTEPYGMHKQTTEKLYGNDMFEGYAIDLIEKLSELEGFNYTFLVREDKSNGAYDEKLKKWTGMIGDLLEYKADLAICDFTITSEREQVVDFTVPFMSLGISILFKEPENAPPSFFSFADPFGLETWMALGASFFVVSLSFYFMGRLCADEWTNPFPCIEEPEYLVNQFSLNNSLWFATGALLAQGSEIAPIAISTRMASGMWWYFCLIMSASYTANLAAFLANENPIKLFTDLQSLYDKRGEIQFGAKKEGATLRYFTSAEEGSLLRKVGQYMIDHPETGVKGNDEGVERAEKERYAFFMESSSIDYATQRHCTLMQYGGLIDEKGYGIAMRKYSPYRKRLSLALLKLQQNHFLDDLKKKWWEERRGGGACSGDTEKSEAVPLGLKNVEGCFYMTIFGTILAAIIVIFEHFLYLLKVKRRRKKPFLEIMKAELRAYADFNNPSKTNLEVVDDKSESKDNECRFSKKSSGEEKKKSKSASKLRSFSRSRSRSKSVSKQKSKSTGKKTPVSYGFIIPSLESLKNDKSTST